MVFSKHPCRQIAVIALAFGLLVHVGSAPIEGHGSGEARRLDTAQITGTADVSVADADTACGTPAFTAVFCSTLESALSISTTCTCTKSTASAVSMGYEIWIYEEDNTDPNDVVDAITGTSVNLLSYGFSSALDQAGMSSMQASITAVATPSLEIIAALTTTTKATTIMAVMTTTTQAAEPMDTTTLKAATTTEEAESMSTTKAASDGRTSTTGMGNSMGMTTTSGGESSITYMMTTTTGMESSVTHMTTTTDVDSPSNMATTTDVDSSSNMATTTDVDSPSNMATTTDVDSPSNMATTTTNMDSFTVMTTTTFMEQKDASTKMPTTTGSPAIYQVDGTATMSVEDAADACASAVFTPTVCGVLAGFLHPDVECTCSLPARRLSERKLAESVIISFTVQTDEESANDLVSTVRTASYYPSAITSQLTGPLDQAGYVGFNGVTAISQATMKMVTTTSKDPTATTISGDGGSDDEPTTTTIGVTTTEKSAPAIYQVDGTATMSVEDAADACESAVFTPTVCGVLAGFLHPDVECTCSLPARRLSERKLAESVIISFTVQTDEESANNLVSTVRTASYYPSAITSQLTGPLNRAGYVGFNAVTAIGQATMKMVTTTSKEPTATTVSSDGGNDEEPATTAVGVTTTTVAEEEEEEELESEIIEENVTVVEGSANVEVEDAEAACNDTTFVDTFCSTLGDAVGATPECTCTPETTAARRLLGRRLAQTVNMAYEITIAADSEVSVDTVTANIKTVSESPSTLTASLETALSKANVTMTVTVASVPSPTTKTVTVVITRTRTSTITTTVAEVVEYEDVEVNVTIIEGTATLEVEDATAACNNTDFTEAICAALAGTLGVTPECTCTASGRRLSEERRLAESAIIGYTITIEDGSDANPTSLMSLLNTAVLMPSLLLTPLNSALVQASVDITVTGASISSPTSRRAVIIVQREKTSTDDSGSDSGSASDDSGSTDDSSGASDDSGSSEDTTTTLLDEDDTKLAGTIRVTVDGDIEVSELKAQAEASLILLLGLVSTSTSTNVKVTTEGNYYILTYSIFTQENVDYAIAALTGGTTAASTFLTSFGDGLSLTTGVTVTAVTVANLTVTNRPATTTTGSAGKGTETDAAGTNGKLPFFVLGVALTSAAYAVKF